jgi:hypothetical protein
VDIAVGGIFGRTRKQPALAGGRIGRARAAQEQGLRLDALDRQPVCADPSVLAGHEHLDVGPAGAGGRSLQAPVEEFARHSLAGFEACGLDGERPDGRGRLPGVARVAAFGGATVIPGADDEPLVFGGCRKGSHGPIVGDRAGKRGVVPAGEGERRDVDAAIILDAEVRFGPEGVGGLMRQDLAIDRDLDPVGGLVGCQQGPVGQQRVEIDRAGLADKAGDDQRGPADRPGLHEGAADVGGAVEAALEIGVGADAGEPARISDGGLEGVGSAVGTAPHADLARGPGLASGPFDDLRTIPTRIGHEA